MDIFGTECQNIQMINRWFETVAVAEQRARKRLPKSVYAALRAGSERGCSSADNVAAFDELGFGPRVAELPAKRDLATTVMGQPISMPVLISPTGVQAVHPDGELALARAAASRGTIMGLSSFASTAIEAVTAVNGQTMFQLYWSGDRDQILGRMHRARAAGAVGLILTLDWSFANGRDWGSPVIPGRIDARTAVRFAPDVARHPAWLAQFARRLRLPDLTVPNLVGSDGKPLTFFQAYGEWMQTPPPTWDDVAWAIEQWDGQVMLKGISRVDDARRAVDAGVAAISVSNHGGNNLDSTPAPIRLLPDIATAVGDTVEVLMDGGVRRGGDVVKAMSLGARAVMVGRATLWGLAANGQAGVENVLDILRAGIDSSLLGLGHPSVHTLSSDDVAVPADFTRCFDRGRSPT